MLQVVCMTEGLSLIGISGTSSNCPSHPLYIQFVPSMEDADEVSRCATTVVLFCTYDFLMFETLYPADVQHRNLTLNVEVSLQRL